MPLPVGSIEPDASRWPRSPRRRRCRRARASARRPAPPAAGWRRRCPSVVATMRAPTTGPGDLRRRRRRQRVSTDHERRARTRERDVTTASRPADCAQIRRAFRDHAVVRFTVLTRQCADGCKRARRTAAGRHLDPDSRTPSTGMDGRTLCSPGLRTRTSPRLGCRLRGVSIPARWRRSSVRRARRLTGAGLRPSRTCDWPTARRRSGPPPGLVADRRSHPPTSRR